MQGRENRLLLTVYEDANETTPEDLTGKTFSATFYDPNSPTTIYATAIGDHVVVSDPESGVIEIVLDYDAFDGAEWDLANYVVDDITTPGTPKPFLPPDQIGLTHLPPATVP